MRKTKQFLITGVTFLALFIFMAATPAGDSWQADNSDDIYFMGGNVGIGTDSPTRALDVQGNAIFQKNGAPGLNTQVAVKKNDDSSFAYYTCKPYSSNSDSNPSWCFGMASSAGLNKYYISTWNGVVENYRFVISTSGNVGIGTYNPTHKLSVNGTIKAKEIIVDTAGWSDFVFEEDYDLRSLEEVEEYIEDNGHLPNIPSAAEVTEEGISLGEMDARLLQKVEELTLYMIEMKKENETLKSQIEALQSMVE